MNNELNLGEIIKQKLEEQERSVAWLAKKIPIDRSNLYKILQQSYIPHNVLWRISKVLDYDFFKYYSENLKE
jgi:plasmid maintenance system antidote protein VapI